MSTFGNHDLLLKLWRRVCVKSNSSISITCFSISTHFLLPFLIFSDNNILKSIPLQFFKFASYNIITQEFFKLYNVNSKNKSRNINIFVTVNINNKISYDLITREFFKSFSKNSKKKKISFIFDSYNNIFLAININNYLIIWIYMDI